MPKLDINQDKHNTWFRRWGYFENESSRSSMPYCYIWHTYWCLIYNTKIAFNAITTTSLLRHGTFHTLLEFSTTELMAPLGSVHHRSGCGLFLTLTTTFGPSQIMRFDINVNIHTNPTQSTHWMQIKDNIYIEMTSLKE